MKTSSDYPSRDGIIANFRSGDSEYLELIRQDLSLAMPLYVLSHLSSFFKIKAKYDPTVDLLIMLDILWANAKAEAKKGKKLLLCGLESDSAEIYGTFRDLEKNLSHMRPGIGDPFSFDEIFSAAGRVIENELPSSLNVKADVSEMRGECILYPEFAKSLGHSAVISAFGRSFVFSAPHHTEEIRNGAFFLIDTVPEFDSHINERLTVFIEKLGDECIAPYCRVTIVERSLIESVLEFSENAVLAHYSSLREFATFGKGKLLVFCPEKHAQELVLSAASLGLLVMKVGKAQKKGGLELISAESGKVTTLKTELIKNLLNFERSEAVNVILKAEDDIPAAQLENVQINENPFDGLSLSAASSDSPDAPYHSGIAQVISAVSGEIAKGADTDEIVIKNIVSAGGYDNVLSHMLGLYRAQLELCVRDIRSSLSTDAADLSSVTFAFSGAKRREPDISKSAWLVIPEDEDSGISFKNIRKTFAFMSALLKEDKAAFALPITEKRAETILAEYAVLPVKSPCGFIVFTDAFLEHSDGIKIEKILKK